MTTKLPLQFPDPPTPPAKPWRRGGPFLNNEAFFGLTVESLAAYKTAVADYRKAVEEWRRECCAIVARAEKLLIDAGFPHKYKKPARSMYPKWVKLVDMLMPLMPPTPPPLPGIAIEERWLADKIERDNADIANREAAAFRDRAVVYLMQCGQVYGKDFTADTATKVALQVAAAEVITKKIDEGMIAFSDDNCENCGGWDGKSRRCDCGNRRVGWVIEGTFEAPIVYAEAY